MTRHDDVTELTDTEEAALAAETARIAALVAPLLHRRAVLMQRLGVISGPAAARRDLERRLDVIEARLAAAGVEVEVRYDPQD